MSASSVFGTVEWKIQKTFTLDKSPLAVATSVKGTWFFVLTDEGTVLVYDSTGRLREEIDVGRHIDGIDAGPRDEILVGKYLDSPR